MHRTPWIASALLVVVGMVWIGQGTGILTGNSPMVGDLAWAYIGSGLVIAAGALAVWAWRRSSRNR